MYGGCLLPRDDGHLQQNCRSDPAIHALALRSLSRFSLSLSFAFMSDLFWTGDHSKTAVERLRLAEDLAVDVRIDSNIYNALNLARFPKNATHNQFVVVPAQLLFLAAGGAFHLYQEAPKPWGVVTSLPSMDTLEHTLKNAYDKGFVSMPDCPHRPNGST